MCPLMKLIRVNSRQQRRTNVLPRTGKLVKSDSTASDTAPAEPPRKLTFNSKILKCVAFFTVIFLVLAMAIIALFFTYNSFSSPASNETTHDNSTLWSLIYRSQWGAEPVPTLAPLQLPVSLVILAHTVTPFCRTSSECSARVLSIQQYHLHHIKLADISYNFLVGGDGNVYEGRGWAYQNNLQDGSILISFIGDYRTNELSSDMVVKTLLLLNEGLADGRIAKDYKLICHNQTRRTLSPGENVYKIVSSWKHFDPGNFFN